MRRTLSLLTLFAVCALGLSFGNPAQAAAVTKFTGTIAAPLADVGSLIGGGYPLDTPRSKVNCPQAGPGDGVFYKFFDLKKGYTKFTAYGPKPVVNQPLPGNPLYKGAIMEYDIDVYLFDAKCKPIDTPGGGDVGGFEKTTAPPKNPARYVVITYYDGPYMNIPVTLEASN